MHKFLRIFAVFTLAAGSFFPCFAEPNDEPKAHVTSHDLHDGTRVVFAWDQDKKVPFTIDTKGNKVILHFKKPVSLIWGKLLSAPNTAVKQVETEKNGSTVILTLARPEATRYFMSYGKNGVDLLGATNKMPIVTLPPRQVATVKHRSHPRITAKKPGKKNVLANNVREKKGIVQAAPMQESIQPLSDVGHTNPASGTAELTQNSPAPNPASVDLKAVEARNASPVQGVIELPLLSPAAGKPAKSDTTPAPSTEPTVHVGSPPAVSQSIPAKTADTAPTATAATAPTTLFPYARWKLADEKELVPTERKLFHDIAYGTMDSSNKARLKLLDIYLAEGLFPEAHGMADDILRSSLKFYKANKVAALRGASYFFMYHINDAERDFSSPELMNDPEAGLWRTLCKELLGEERGSESFNFLGNYDHIIRNYPPVFIQKLAIIAADLSINRKEYDAALNIFSILKKDNLEDPVKKYVDYMRAKVASETKNEEDAAQIWEQQAKEIDDPLIRARAEFSLVNMLLREDKIEHDEATRRLEKLRIVWRGDSLELGVLTLLGNLYAEDKQYAKALHTLRDIVLYYPEVPEAVTVAKKMEEIFVALYNKGNAKELPPLEALSLFYEFRDLVPVGKDGDQMIRNLADRLVDIDLLDRAATLLDHQIRKRLDGEERSRVGARLALIYLMNHQPKEALETLKTTGFGDLPADLQLTRLHLTAQALAQQGQVTKAIEVLSSDNGAAGTVLRLSIYWDNKDWPNVVTTAEEILSNRNDPSAALSAQESEVLLKLATAYVYEHDSGQIQYLRDYFTPLLNKNASKDSFLFITSESGTIDYENLANLNQDITEVKSFLDNYRDQVKKNGLSKAIN